MNNYLRLIRVKHWIKNLLIFIPFVCSKQFSYINMINCILGFFVFSSLSSFIYIVNDIRDIEKDKLHPVKKNRPLSSGKIKKSVAIAIAVILLLISIVLNTLINSSIINQAVYFLVAYFIVNVAYSFGLKNVAIFDVILLASGFVFRVYYGAAIVSVEVSRWLFLTIGSASLFLGLGKRKKELQTSKESRKVLSDYNESFLDKFQYIMLGLTLVFYSLWTIEQKSKYLYLTVPIIIVLFMRYCLITEKSNEGDPTTILYQDKFLMFFSFIYGVVMLILLGGF